MIDGHVAYQGLAQNLTKHFAMIGAVCPTRQNPSDFYMQYLSVMYPISDTDNKKIQMITDHYDKTLGNQVKTESEMNHVKSFEIVANNNASFCTEFRELFVRSHKGMKRNPLAVKARVGQTIVMALISIMLFWQVNGVTRKERYNVVGATFFFCVSNTMMPMMGTLGLFQGERPVFLREQANKMYGTFPYFATKTLTEQPINVFATLLYAILIYYSVGFTNTIEGVVLFFVTILL